MGDFNIAKSDKPAAQFVSMIASLREINEHPRKRKRTPQMRDPSFVLLEISASVRQGHVNDQSHLHQLHRFRDAHKQLLQL